MDDLQTNVSSIQRTEEQLPSEALVRLRQILSPDDYTAALLSFSRPKPIVFRVNTLRASVEDVLNEIKSAGLVVSPIVWCPLGFILEKGTLRELQALQAGKEGWIYIQAASSMAAANAMQVEEGMSVLDMCAAPGSKTSQLAAVMNNSGILIANDRSKKRLYRLREVLKWQNAINVEILCGAGEQLGKTYSDCFEKVLVDVPCSGEGRFRLDKPTRLERWNVQTIRRLAKMQEQLLIAALKFHQNIPYVSKKINSLSKKGKTIAIHGSSNGLNNLFFLSDLEKYKNIKIFDNDSSKTGKYLPACSIPIKHSSDPNYKTTDIVFVAALSFYDEIKDFLISTHGLAVEQILPLNPQD